jgi:gamma-glutamyl phosphate reductase
MTIPLMRIAIRSYEPYNLDDKTIDSFLKMRKNPKFKRLWKDIDKKIKEVKEVFQEEKKKAEKTANPSGVPSDIIDKLRKGDAKLEERGDGITVIHFTMDPIIPQK